MTGDISDVPPLPRFHPFGNMKFLEHIKEHRCSKCGLDLRELCSNDLDLASLISELPPPPYDSDNNHQLTHPERTPEYGHRFSDVTRPDEICSGSSSDEDELPSYYSQLPMKTDPVDFARKLQGGDSSLPKSMSLPLRHGTPDPFPELISPLTPTVSFIRSDSISRSSPTSPIVRRKSSRVSMSQGNQENVTEQRPVSPKSQDTAPALWTASNKIRTMLNFYNDERSHRTVSVEENMRASDVCHLLVLKNHALEDKSWVIVEHVSKFNLERSLEDHESVLHVFRNWGHAEENRFYFRKDFRKYELFRQPTQFFPSSMLDIRELKEDASSSLISKADRQKNVLLQNLFGAKDTLPDIQGYLHMKETKKGWKKYFFVLRKSGLYYSMKGTSKDPKYLVYVTGLGDLNIYTALNAKKTLGAPNNYCLCLKPQQGVTDQKDLKLFCAENEQARACWIMGMRLVKYGSTIIENCRVAIKWEDKLEGVQVKPNGFTSQENIYVKSRVAMDFTGHRGRVVEDPQEAKGVAVAEGYQWRKKAHPRKPAANSSPNPAGTSFISEMGLHPSHGLCAGVHMSQPWFHSGISREESVNLITKQGLVDGVFLVRESQSIPDMFVLSLCHNHKVKHCQIKKAMDDGQEVFTLDGKMKFVDLIQLVEFHQLNAYNLPTKLTHYVTRLV